MTRAISAALLLLFTATASAQTADLTVSLQAAPVYNAGEPATVTATLTNLGPDAASLPGVRLKKNVASPRSAAEQPTCIDLSDSVLCSVPTLAAGASQQFSVPFFPPYQPGPITLNARTESLTRDPNPDNDSAAVETTVVDLVDLLTTIDTFPGLQPGKESRITVAVEEQAARVATAVRLSVTIPAPLEIIEASPNCDRSDGDAGSWTCTIRDLARGFVDRAVFRVLTPAGSSGPVTITASATSSSADWNDGDNRLTSAEPIFALPDLTATISASETLDERNRGTVQVTIANPTDIPAPSIAADIVAGGTIVSWNAPGWSCRQTDSITFSCGIDSLAAHATSTIQLDIQYAAHEISTGVFVKTTQSPPIPNFKTAPQIFRVDKVYYRTFDVTSAADSGPGSLRQAIADSNDQCSAELNAPPCRIAFRIPAPVPADGWFTIEPRSPLPTITSTDFAIDGETQTVLTGDTNPLGPEVFLLGDAAGTTDGIRLLTKAAVVQGLAIGGFAENGMQLLIGRPLHYTIERNYLGIDPTGRVAVPNGLRGIQASGFAGTIANNVISGNRRSGAFLVDCDSTVVTANRIGVAAATDDPLPNGAAGLFFHETYPFSEVRVQGNVIAYNGEDGISTSGRSRISLLDNLIAYNRTQIDMGLDGPTPGEEDGVAAPPLITSARYGSATGETIIEGSVPVIRVFPETSTIYLYANASDAEGGEEFIAAAVADRSGHFSLRIHRDLRGRHIDGTTHHVIDFGDYVSRTSSEFARPVPVTE